ncbi:hypothetical protein E4U56_007245 [Claviceps arundinis]|uniref:Uncharacterized protein n=1 Tax=Claviceps arundinis TaxID=1623583 RepID=A0A9P7MV60_9HYPO|nr:hypothetical protein E4U56_007245 [Claviceps arundinis]
MSTLSTILILALGLFLALGVCIPRKISSLPFPKIEENETHGANQIHYPQASVSALAVPEPTTSLFVPSWDVAIEPGQNDSDKIVVNGTIQQVDAYMEAHYPGWSAKLANFTSSHSAPAKRSPRSPEWMTKKAIECNQLLRVARTSAILEGINYLRSISTDRHPRNGPGPRSCDLWQGQLLVGWGYRLGDEPKTVDSFSDIAAGAASVVKKLCHEWYGAVGLGTGVVLRELASVSARSVTKPITHRVVPNWEVAIDPEQYRYYNFGDTILVNGTIQQVDAYMEAHYPGWTAKHAKFSTPYWIPPKETETPASSPKFMKVKRVVCTSPLHQVSTRAVLGAIDDLRNISEHRGPKWLPKPGTCGKLSCTDEGAIFCCNDSDTRRVMGHIGFFSDIVVAAEAVLSQCAMSGDTLMPMVSGKTTVFGDHSFVVGKSSCGDKWLSTGH